MKQARIFNVYFTRFFGPPFERIELRTSDSIRSELMGSFGLYGEVKKIGQDLLRKNGHQLPAKSFLRLQAYLRQAKTFFEAAEALHHRASPLNYYYSFMNFAKAAIFVNDPQFSDTNLKHGLAQTIQSGHLKSQSLAVKVPGVFPSFYRLATGTALANNAVLKITDLLGYAGDVAFEFERLAYGSHASFRCKLAVVATNSNLPTAHTLIAVFRGSNPIFVPSLPILKKSFEQVELNPQHANSLFGVSQQDLHSVAFFQGKATYPAEANLAVNMAPITAAVATALAPIIWYAPFITDELFTLNHRIRTPALRPMNEMIAIYCCMFFFGSLVRYRPDYLEAMLATKDAWLIERFLKSAPLTFLRHLRNLVDGEYQALAPR